MSIIGEVDKVDLDLVKPLKKEDSLKFGVLYVHSGLLTKNR